MRPTREDANRMLSVLRTCSQDLGVPDYAALYDFILKCTKYLPSREAVKRDSDRKRTGRVPLYPPPEDTSRI